MVQYDENNNALTLGDDDALEVGDYELRYSSGNDQFEIEYTPSGDLATIPRTQSGSMFPVDLTDAISNGEVLADDGNIYSSVQSAVTNATDYVLVGPGTFNENVSITDGSMMLEGSGRGTYIDGGTSGHALTVEASNCTVRNISVGTTAGGGSASSPLRVFGAPTDTLLSNIWFRESDERACEPDGNRTIVQNCTFEQADGHGIRGGGTNCIYKQNKFETNIGNDAIRVESIDCVVSDNVIDGPGTDGIDIANNDCLCAGNRVRNAGGDGIFTNAQGVLIVNNRVSGSGDKNINNNGSGNLIQDNLTG